MRRHPASIADRTDSGELKPIYVDLCSTLSVDVFAAFVRHGADTDPAMRLTIAEMLPTPRQCWLTDRDGNRYVSELRVVVLAPEKEEIRGE